MRNPKHYVLQWLMEELRKYPTFTTKQAAEIYWTRRRVIPTFGNPKGENRSTYWSYCNACLSLSAAVQIGMLQRIRKGVYAWKSN